MSKDVSIVFKASDGLSESLKQMRKNVNSLSNDVTEYRKIQDQAFQKKTEIKFDIVQAKKDLKDLTKAVQDNVDGAKEAFMDKQLALEKLNEEYKRLSQVAKEAGKAERDLAADMSRTSNANAGRGFSSSLSGFMNGLASAGLGSMIGSAAQNYMNTTLTSVFGQNTGGMVSGVIGGGIQGAAIGSIAGPIGTAVGAAVGGLTGAINALADKNSREDDYFRSEVQSLHSSAINEMNSALERSSVYASEREDYQRNYASMTDDATGAKLYQAIKEYGDKTPYDTSVMLAKGMEMLSYGIEKEKIMDYTDMIGNIAMGNANKFSGLSYAIAQSMGAGVLNGQDRNQMVGWGFDPLEYVAKNEGITKAAAKDLMSDGKITAEMLEDAMRTATSEGERFHDAVNAMSDTFSGLQGQLESAKKNIEIAMGEGYNAARKEGMAREIEAYNGQMGEQMKEAYRMIGAYEAEMENQHQQSILNALEQANQDIESKGLEGLDAQKRMWEAYTEAEIEYKNGEEYQKKLQAEKDLVQSIQGALVESGDYVSFGSAMANEFSKGWSSTRTNNAVNDIKSLGGGSFLNGLFARTALKYGTPTGHATGLPRVPYDGYPAILHEGEQVLTRVEADKQKNGTSGVHVAKLADSIIVREEADIDKFATAFARKIMAAAECYAG